VTAASDREEGQRRRADARRLRRDAAQSQPEVKPEENTEPDESGDSQSEGSHEGLKQAAKVAVAGAAVGAAVGAARAITSKDGGDEESQEEATAAQGERAEEARERRPDQGSTQEAVESDSQTDADEDPAAAEPTDTSEAADEPSREAGQPAETSAGEPIERDSSPRHEQQLEGGTLEETTEVVRIAREQLQALHGRDAESVSSLERTTTGWTVTFELVELRRVPDSTDVLASYEVVLDQQMNVTRSARTRRYYRSQADREAG
jgi:hypothetical protein